VKVATIDIGTNSVLLLIAERRDGVLVPLLERATITRLGQNVDATRRLLPEAVERTLSCLASYAGELGAFGVDRLGAVGTSAMRDAAGGSEFIEAAGRLLGEPPRVISGDEEAELTFHGALSGLELGGAVSVFDVGGGSTEIINGQAGANPSFTRGKSLDIGSVRLFERHVRNDPPRKDELERARDDIRSALATVEPPDASSGITLVGVAGTVTTLAAIELGLTDYDPARVHGARLGRASVSALAEKLAKLSLAERQALAGLEPKRADVIVIGAAIVQEVLDWSGSSELVVSDRGVRWGLAERLA
jgi:exopolyphosphatase/guanosine-5'-triphosphate,3'-diphosphate pyrophosphatase